MWFISSELNALQGIVVALLDGAIAVCQFSAATLPMEAMATVESSLYQTQAKRSRGEQ